MKYREVKVGIGDYKIAKSPDRLMTIGLGSCIGIAMIDKKSGIGGLAHIMLPDSKKFNKISNEIKFANLAIPILIRVMVENGAKEKELRAKIAGGATMFNFADNKVNMDIGARNSIAVKAILKARKIPIDSEEIGGTKGRTIIFDTVTGDLYVKIIGEGTKII
ncbi:chemotaxis protein CheD [Clostridium sp. UBA1056]|uniref:chemotaxis protein CheD n=1 Tax=unclassified Clostridium TaxID=2614128 RepID=UPI003216D65A